MVNITKKKMEDYFFGGNNKNEANISHYHDNTI